MFQFTISPYTGMHENDQKSLSETRLAHIAERKRWVNISYLVLQNDTSSLSTIVAALQMTLTGISIYDIFI